MSSQSHFEDGISAESIYERTVLNLLLVDLGSPANIGAIIRTCYSLGGVDVGLFIYDPRDNLEKFEEDIEKTSLGLSQRPGTFARILDLQDFLGRFPGRPVKTDITSDAISLPEFHFRRRDLILVGNENRGYHTKDLEPQPGTEQINTSVVIPMLGQPYEVPDSGSVRLDTTGQFANLNVGITAGIVTYCALKQLGRLKGFQLGK